MIYDNFLLTRIHHYLSTIIHPDFLLGIILDSNQICPGSEGKRGAPQPALAHWVGVTDTILVFTQLKRLAEDGGFRTGHELGVLWRRHVDYLGQQRRNR
jgi:hypothetical protein